MPILNPNPTPYSVQIISKYLNSENLTLNDKLTMVDIGSRGGVRPEWRSIEPYCHFIGFDADADECARLNQIFPNTKTYPVALAGSTGEGLFLTAKSGACGGFRATNEAFWRRIPNYINNVITGSVPMRTQSLDDWANSQNYNSYDFIKIDTEGSESDIIRGGLNTLHGKKCLGVLSELWIEGDTKQGSGYGFGAQDEMLRAAGFRFYDIQISRYPRSSLPMGRLHFFRNTSGQLEANCAPLRSIYGQALTGDILYFRDPILDFSQKPDFAKSFWDSKTLLRLVALLDLYNYQDVALDILSNFRSKFSQQLVNELVTALLTDVANGEEITLPYTEYWRHSFELFKAHGGCNEPALIEQLEVEPALFH